MNTRHFSTAIDGPVTPLQGASFFDASRSLDTASPFDATRLAETARSVQYGHVALNGPDFNSVDSYGLSGVFIENADMRRTREESARDTQPGMALKFGQFVLRSAEDYEATTNVVMKPFSSARGAAYEYMVMAYFNRLYAPPFARSSYRPVGFYVDPQYKTTAVVSEYDGTVISHDNLFWNPDREPAELEAEKAIGDCAEALGYIHGQQKRFGDSQVKNFAKGNHGIRLIDVESIQSMVNKRGEVDPVEATTKMRADIETLFKSLHRFDDDDYTSFLEHMFIPMYLRVVNEPESILPEAIRLTAVDLLDVLHNLA